MKSVDKIPNKFWPTLKYCWMACLTCLVDRDFFAEWGGFAAQFIRGCWYFTCKVLATLIFPISGLILALVVMRARRQKDSKHPPTNQAY